MSQECESIPVRVLNSETPEPMAEMVLAIEPAKQAPAITESQVPVARVSKRKEWKRTFLRALARTGNVTKSAEIAEVTQVHVYRVKRRSSRFAAAWAKAKQLARKAYVDRAEAALEERGVHGWEEPVYQDGKLVGTKTKYSDRLLLRGLEASDPKRYTRRTETHTTSQVSIQVHAAQAKFLDPVVMALVLKLDEAMATAPAIEQAQVVQAIPQTDRDSIPG